MATTSHVCTRWLRSLPLLLMRTAGVAWGQTGAAAEVEGSAASAMTRRGVAWRVELEGTRCALGGAG